jgi:hypothetical protein
MGALTGHFRVAFDYPWFYIIQPTAQIIEGLLYLFWLSTIILPCSYAPAFHRRSFHLFPGQSMQKMMWQNCDATGVSASISIFSCHYNSNNTASSFNHPINNLINWQYCSIKLHSFIFHQCHKISSTVCYTVHLRSRCALTKTRS